VYNRLYKLPKDNSFFLFGPRQTGKSTLVKLSYPTNDVVSINLLKPELYRRYVAKPELFWEVIRSAKQPYIFVDEIQRVPELLNIIQEALDTECGKYFILTGSSSRKLRQFGANLLGGRAWSLQMFPLTYQEFEANNLTQSYPLEKILSFGTLPAVVNRSSDHARQELLRAYIDVYINEEIAMEALTRKLDSFIRFLPVAAQSNSEQINASNIADDVGISSHLVTNYFEILKDTLIGHFLHAFHASERKRHKVKPKFYFFDTGILRAAQQRLSSPVLWPSFEAGQLFETFIINQVIAISQLNRKDFRFSFLRTASDVEVDLIIETPQGKILGIEIKSKETPTPSDYQAGFNALLDICPQADCMCVCTAPFESVQGGIKIIPFEKFLQFLSDL
jgi:uncharacterized protein